MLKFKKKTLWIVALGVFAVAAAGFVCFNKAWSEKPTENFAPKVSVVVPVYKVEKYLGECADSLFNQTLKDIEIIFVDDGSPDNCPKMLDAYAKKDKRVKVIHQKNGGLPAAREAGMKIAVGEYIKHVDSDDVLDIQACEICYNEAKKFDADILAHGAYGFNKEKKWDNWSAPYEEIENAHRFNLIDNPVWEHMYKNEFIKINNISYEGIASMSEDQCFNLKCIPRARRIKIIPNKLYYYRVDNRGSLCNTVSGRKHAKDHFKNLRIIGSDWKNSGYFKENIAKTEFLKWALGLHHWKDIYEINRMFVDSIDSDLLSKETLNLLPADVKKTFEKIISLAHKSNDSLKSGVYSIVSALGAGKVLEVNESNVQIGDKNGSEFQKFKISAEKDGTYSFECIGSGKMIGAESASYDSGVNICECENSGERSGRWYVVPAGEGCFKIVSACIYLCADVSGAKTDSGTNLQCFEPNGSNAQKFKFIKAN